MSTHQFPRHERGAALFIALIMLLVITLLALSGARETALENRITGNMAEQQNLVNYGEAALRQGERALTSPVKPREQNDDCTGSYCLLKAQPVYPQSFTKSLSYSPVTGESNQQVKWYAVPAPSGAAQGQAENPEYGNMMLGIGTFRYEINAEATNTENTENRQKARLRSTTAKVFN